MCFGAFSCSPAYKDPCVSGDADVCRWMRDNPFSVVHLHTGDCMKTWVRRMQVGEKWHRSAGRERLTCSSCRRFWENEVVRVLVRCVLWTVWFLLVVCGWLWRRSVWAMAGNLVWSVMAEVSSRLGEVVCPANFLTVHPSLSVRNRAANVELKDLFSRGTIYHS